MQKNLTKVLSFVLALVMVLGLLPISALASEAQVASSDLPTAIEGLSIAYPYNTETVQLTGTPADHFDALTFETARGEVESAQLILTPVGVGFIVVLYGKGVKNVHIGHGAA